MGGRCRPEPACTLQARNTLRRPPALLPMDARPDASPRRPWHTLRCWPAWRGQKQRLGEALRRAVRVCGRGLPPRDSRAPSSGGGRGRQRSHSSPPRRSVATPFPKAKFRWHWQSRCDAFCCHDMPKAEQPWAPTSRRADTRSTTEKAPRGLTAGRTRYPRPSGGGQGKQKAAPGLAVRWHLTPEHLEPAAVCTRDIAASISTARRPIAVPALLFARCVLNDVQPQPPATQELQTGSDQDGGTSVLWTVDCSTDLPGPSKQIHEPTLPLPEISRGQGTHKAPVS
jgi:hypothetical protein